MRTADLSPQARVTPLQRLPRLLAVIGPGLIVMLADIEAGSVITLAQSGAQWGYRLLLLQILLIPLMFMAQELTVRLGLCTGKGYAELVGQRYGRPIVSRRHRGSAAELLRSADHGDERAGRARQACLAFPPGKR